MDGRRKKSSVERTASYRRIYEEIARKLADKINSGELPDGSLLPSERELAETFGASRTSVREALLSLQSAGLISVRQRARARVTQFSEPAFFNQLTASARILLGRPNGVEEFQEVRMFYECALARYAALHASPKELDKLALALVDNKKSMGDPTLFARTDVAFHQILAAMPQNPILTAVHNALAEWLLDQRTLGIQGVRGAARRAYEGHEQIYEAIAEHDVDAADEAMASHLTTVIEHYRKAKAKPH